MSEEMIEKVRDFVYDCTKDEFNHGWTLSRHQTDDLIALLSAYNPNERLSLSPEQEDLVVDAFLKQLGKLGGIPTNSRSEARYVIRVSLVAAFGAVRLSALSPLPQGED